MKTRTFNTPEELMIALLQGEKWQRNEVVYSYDQNRRIEERFRATGYNINESINSYCNLCDGKTLWRKVEEKTELDLMKEKYASGDYVLVTPPFWDCMDYRLKPKKKIVTIIKFYNSKGKILEIDKSNFSVLPKNILYEYEIEVENE